MKDLNSKPHGSRNKNISGDKKFNITFGEDSDAGANVKIEKFYKTEDNFNGVPNSAR